MIRVEGLVKRFGDRTVLDGIDLEIAAGERIVVIGPSGTGKSTLLRCLNFLDRPDAGRITLGDHAVDAAHASRARHPRAAAPHRLRLPELRALRQQDRAPEHHRGPDGGEGMPRAEAEARADAILAEIGLADRGDAYPPRFPAVSSSGSASAGRWRSTPS